MRNTGMSRAIDPLDRIVLPKEIRDSMGLETGVQMDIGVSNDCIVLRKNVAFCACCGGNHEHMLHHAGVALCPDCMKELKEVSDNDDF